MKFPANPRRIANGFRHGMEFDDAGEINRALDAGAVALFYAFRDGMARQGAKGVGLRPMLSGLPAVS